MDGFVSRGDLITDAQLKRVSARSDLKGLVQLGVHLSALVCSGVWVWQTRNSWQVVPALLVHGVLLNFLFSALHETIHRTAFKRRWLNDIVAWCAGVLLMLPPGYFRHFHFAHHRYTQAPDKDPELASPKPVTLLAHLWSMSAIGSYWGAGIKVLLTHAFATVGADFIPERARAEVKREAQIVCGIYAAIVAAAVSLQSTEPLLFWVIPIVIAAPSLRLFLHAEHTGCELTAQMVENTRTTASNPWMRLLTWNMPYHVEHHLFPAVPFHALPEVHRQIKGRHIYLCTGYGAYHFEVLKRLLSCQAGDSH